MGYEINSRLKKPIHDTDIDHCPYCGQIFDAAAEISKNGLAPTTGDFSVCLTCGGFLRFGLKLKLRKLPLDEFDSLEPEEKAALLTQYMNLKIYKKLKGKESELTFNLKRYFKNRSNG